jgi:predicted lipid-binding transport protein (Tim44 family)
MQLGKTIVGAIIGAVLGIGLLIVVYLFFGIDKMWMAIPVAILTGLGVRMMAVTSGNASYMRGALTVLLAMGAYWGGLSITKAVANQRAQKAAQAAPAPRSEEAADAGNAKEVQPAADAKAIEAPLAAPIKTDPSRRVSLPTSFSTWDFLSLAVAALVAYELGRGTEAGHKLPADEGPTEPVTGSTHPDA